MWMTAARESRRVASPPRVLASSRERVSAESGESVVSHDDGAGEDDVTESARASDQDSAVPPCPLPAAWRIAYAATDLLQRVLDGFLLPDGEENAAAGTSSSHLLEFAEVICEAAMPVLAHGEHTESSPLTARLLCAALASLRCVDVVSTPKLSFALLTKLSSMLSMVVAPETSLLGSKGKSSRAQGKWGDDNDDSIMKPIHTARTKNIRPAKARSTRPLVAPAGHTNTAVVSRC